jgi:N6-L-threonylcarbamoyladenine synthase
MAAAKALAYTLGKPLAAVHHLQAHIMAAFLTETVPAFPFVALVVSGGHTNLYRVDGFREMTLLGRSRDDAAGEAFDKVAKLMELGYPGGVRIEALAQEGQASTYHLPRPRVHGEPLTFSFSGLKTAVACRLKQHPEILTDAGACRDLAAGFQAAVVDSLTSRTWLAMEQEGCSRLVVCGGVAANGRLRQVLQEHARVAGLELFLPSPVLCTDNAAMVAALGYRLLMAGEHLDLDGDVFSRG